MDLTIETNMNAQIEIKDFAGRVLYTHQPADSSGMTRTKRQAPCGRATHGCGRRECQADTAAPDRAEPSDPRTPPPGCRLLGDYEPAQAGDMAYIGGIGGRWRTVRPRMGIIGATMDELSDGARVLALARPLPCRCGPDSVACPKGGAA